MLAGERHDLRMPVVGLAAWLTVIAAYLLAERAAWLFALLGLIAAAALAVRHRLAPRVGWLVAIAVLVAAAALAGTVLRHLHTEQSPLTGFAEERAAVTTIGTVTFDPQVLQGQWGDRVMMPMRIREVTARGTTYRLGASVLVLAPSGWEHLVVGEQVRFDGRLAEPSDDPDLAAVIIATGEPSRVRAPDVWWEGAEAVRAAIRASVAERPEAQRALVPGLVVGDVSAMGDGMREDFHTTGLTHLTAVSGTNLTILLGFILVLAKAAGIRGRWLYLVALLGIVGFILLTRTEASVLRAAAMGLVGVFALGTDGRRRGMRALGVAVAGLMLVMPSLALAPAFALSVLATGGLILFGPPITRSLTRWMPRLAAQAIAIPLAAQVAVTPVLAGISGEVSLVAVAANVLVAPVVGPATVLGLAGGLVGLVVPFLGRLCGMLAGWCVGWVAVVAERGARMPQASIGWGTDAVALTSLVLLCVAVIVLAAKVAAHPRAALSLTAVLTLVVLDVPSRVGLAGSWPPDWVVVACDVGQGDAVVVATGPGAALVADAGPDPEAVDGCLRRLGVRHVPILSLSHFHADHVAGIRGVLRGRRVDVIEVPGLLDPPEGVDLVREAAAEAGVPVRLAPYGATRTVGEVVVQVLWPHYDEPVDGPGDGSAANDGSIVMLVESRGVRVLLTGDVEPPSQLQLAGKLPAFEVDVLKVPHHGSRFQHLPWLLSLRPRVALFSAGEDNGYGHPNPDVLAAFAEAGVVKGRTDTDGDVAVLLDAGGNLAVRSRGR